MSEVKNKSISKTKFDLTWNKFKNFLTIDKNHSQKRSAICSDKSRFNVIARWFVNKEWSTGNFRDLLVVYEKNGRSQGTKNKLIAMGKHIDEFKGANIMRTFKTKVEKLPPIKEVLTMKEMHSLAIEEMNYGKYKEFLNQRQESLIMLLTTTGCRIGEALDLTWDNFKHGEYKFVVFLKTKNGEDREVYISNEAYNLLMNLPKRGNYVFVSGRGKQLLSGDVNLDLKNRAKKVGIKKNVYPHLFRHSFITLMLESNTRDSDVCKIVGHSDPKILLRYKQSKPEYYANLMANKLGDAFTNSIVVSKDNFYNKQDEKGCLNQENVFIGLDQDKEPTLSHLHV